MEMEKVAEQTGSDRDVREELEDVQMRLRASREALKTAAEDAAREQAQLESDLAAATLARNAAASRLSAATEEKGVVRERLDALAPRLEAKREEDRVLARGAALRDQYVDWDPRPNRQLDAKGLLVVAVFIVVVILASLFLP